MAQDKPPEPPMGSPLVHSILGKALERKGLEDGDLGLVRRGRMSQARAAAAGVRPRPGGPSAPTTSPPSTPRKT